MVGLPNRGIDRSDISSEIRESFMKNIMRIKFYQFIIIKRFIQISFLTLCISSDPAAAEKEFIFSGRWRVDTSSLTDNRGPTVIDLTRGRFQKDKDDMVIADGQFYSVSGGGYIDQTSILIKNRHFVREVDKIRGKMAYAIDYVVSKDGNILTWHISSYTSPDGRVVKSKTIQRRVGPKKDGAHLISGNWVNKSVKLDSKSDWILKLVEDHFSWRTEGGTGYDAIVGGKAVKIDGDSSGASVLITRPHPDVIVETNLSIHGKREAIMSMRLLPDRKRIQATTLSLQDRKSSTFYLDKMTE